MLRRSADGVATKARRAPHAAIRPGSPGTKVGPGNKFSWISISPPGKFSFGATADLKLKLTFRLDYSAGADDSRRLAGRGRHQ